MKINQQDFDNLKSLLIDMYFTGRENADFFLMMYTDSAINILNKVEQENIKQKQALL